MSMISLRKRFTSDYKLPINICDNYGIFEYFLELYEDAFSAKSKYNDLLKLINDDFAQKPGIFIESCDVIKNTIIDDIKSKPAYIDFISEDLGKYDIPNYDVSSNIYKETNDKKIFISIDITCANFSALKFHNPEILGIEKGDTYSDFIKKYTELNYIKDSKYLREVIFGNLNPKKQIKIEKYITCTLYERLQKLGHNARITCILNDELVYEIDLNDVENVKTLFMNEIDAFSNEFGISFKTVIFELKKHVFKTHINKRVVVYEKRDFFDNNADRIIIPICCPGFYFAQIFKTLNPVYGDINRNDVLFMHEGQLASYMYPLEYLQETQPAMDSE